MEITALADPITAADTTDDTAARIKVEKRDGRVVDFDRLNIYNAIAAAYKELHKPIGGEERRVINAMVDQVESEIADRYTKPVKIEDIQNLVEHELINEHEYDVARAYTSYRLNRDIERSKATDINEAVKRLTSRDESLVRENANKDSNVYATQRDLLAGAV
ncbi:MAG: ATP cone domain-containing protein, partial [Bifidobacteriaceae bacterium]|nr:ATP cone domain-containing protein [Bifidobacteriaceae bacterium]